MVGILTKVIDTFRFWIKSDRNKKRYVKTTCDSVDIPEATR